MVSAILMFFMPRSFDRAGKGSAKRRQTAPGARVTPSIGTLAGDLEPGEDKDSPRPFRGPAGSISPPRPDRRRARGSGVTRARRAMNRRCAHLWPGRHHPCALPARTTMIERATVRVHDGGGGRRSRGRAVSLTQRDELQGRIHGPAHQLSERALVLAAFGHRREHVFARLWVRSDGKAPKEREHHRANCGFHGVEPNTGSPSATDLADGAQSPDSLSLTSNGLPPRASASSSSRRSAAPAIS